MTKQKKIIYDNSRVYREDWSPLQAGVVSGGIHASGFLGGGLAGQEIGRALGGHKGALIGSKAGGALGGYSGMKAAQGVVFNESGSKIDDVIKAGANMLISDGGPLGYSAGIAGLSSGIGTAARQKILLNDNKIREEMRGNMEKKATDKLYDKNLTPGNAAARGFGYTLGGRIVGGTAGGVIGGAVGNKMGSREAGALLGSLAGSSAGAIGGTQAANKKSFGKNVDAVGAVGSGVFSGLAPIGTGISHNVRQKQLLRDEELKNTIKEQLEKEAAERVHDENLTPGRAGARGLGYTVGGGAVGGGLGRAAGHALSRATKTNPADNRNLINALSHAGIGVGSAVGANQAYKKSFGENRSVGANTGAFLLGIPTGVPLAYTHSKKQKQLLDNARLEKEAAERVHDENLTPGRAGARGIGYSVGGGVAGAAAGNVLGKALANVGKGNPTQRMMTQYGVASLGAGAGAMAGANKAYKKSFGEDRSPLANTGTFLFGAPAGIPLAYTHGKKQKQLLDNARLEKEAAVRDISNAITRTYNKNPKAFNAGVAGLGGAGVGALAGGMTNREVDPETGKKKFNAKNALVGAGAGGALGAGAGYGATKRNPAIFVEPTKLLSKSASEYGYSFEKEAAARNISNAVAAGLGGAGVGALAGGMTNREVDSETGKKKFNAKNALVGAGAGGALGAGAGYGLTKKAPTIGSANQDALLLDHIKTTKGKVLSSAEAAALNKKFPNMKKAAAQRMLEDMMEKQAGAKDAMKQVGAHIQRNKVPYGFVGGGLAGAGIEAMRTREIDGETGKYVYNPKKTLRGAAAGATAGGLATGGANYGVELLSKFDKKK